MNGRTPPSEGNSVSSFELSVAPDAILVAAVRRFVGDLCARVLADAEITSKVMVATHELLDNAIRYSSREDASAIRVEIRRLGVDASVLIITKNRAHDDRRRDLERVLQEMNANDSQSTFYEAVLDRAARGVDGAGLGLGRVHVEADFRLTAQLEGEQVVVRAEGRFPLNAR